MRRKRQRRRQTFLLECACSPLQALPPEGRGKGGGRRSSWNLPATLCMLSRQTLGGRRPRPPFPPACSLCEPHGMPRHPPPLPRRQACVDSTVQPPAPPPPIVLDGVELRAAAGPRVGARTGENKTVAPPVPSRRHGARLSRVFGIASNTLVRSSQSSFGSSPIQSELIRASAAHPRAAGPVRVGTRSPDRRCTTTAAGLLLVIV